MQNNVEILDRMLKSLGVKTAIALGEKLGCGGAAVSSWKKRGVPPAVLLQVSKMTGRTVEWFTGAEQEKEKPQDDPILELVLAKVRETYGSRTSDSERLDVAKAFSKTAEGLKKD